MSMLLRLRNAIAAAGGLSPVPAARQIQSNVRLFAALLVTGTAVAVLYHAILSAFGATYPWNTFLFNPVDRYNDWIKSVEVAATPDPYYTKGGGAYFPFSYLALRVGAVSSQILSLAIFKAISAALICTGSFLFWRNNFAAPAADRQTRQMFLLPLLLIVFVNYPLWFGLDRGNLDLWICGLCLIYVGELGRPASLIGPLALGVAVALKGYPLALILLGLQQCRYRESALAVLTAIALTLLALLQFKSGMAASWQGFQLGQHNFFLENVVGKYPMMMTTDPYNGAQTLAWIALSAWRQLHATTAIAPPVADLQQHAEVAQAVVQGNLSTSMLQQRILLVNIYTKITLILAAISSFYVLFVPAPAWKRVTVIAVTAILYPHVAGDYKLLMLLPAILTLLATPAPDKAQRRAFWIFAALMIPKSYLFIYGRGITMLVNPMLLVALWGVAMWDPGAWKKFRDTFKSSGLKAFQLRRPL